MPDFRSSSHSLIGGGFFLLLTFGSAGRVMATLHARQIVSSPPIWEITEERMSQLSFEVWEKRQLLLSNPTGFCTVRDGTSEDFFLSTQTCTGFSGFKRFMIGSIRAM